MKIYFIGQKGIPAIYGGVERHVENLSTRLATEGNEVFVYVRKHYTPEDLTEYKGVKLIHLPSINTKHLDAIFHTLLATLDVLRKDADIIHYHAIGPSSLLWIPRLLKRKAKIVSTFHSDDRNHRKWGFIAKKFLGLGAYISVKMPHKTIGVSQYQCDTHSKEFNGHLDYIPNGVPHSQTVEPQLITEKWGLQGNDYILAVSRLIKHKGIHHLIKAYQALNETNKKLVITGDSNFTDDYVKYLKDLAGDNKNIIFTGNQSGQVLAELYSNTYLFVQPSEAEGLSIALLEAMSYGKAVLYSDIAPNIEATAGIGLSFKSKDFTDLKEKMQYLLDNPDFLEQVGQKLKSRALTEYDWNVITKKTNDLYKELMQESSKKLVPDTKSVS